jgi:hypothetical protein
MTRHLCKHFGPTTFDYKCNQLVVPNGRNAYSDPILLLIGVDV